MSEMYLRSLLLNWLHNTTYINTNTYYLFVTTEYYCVDHNEILAKLFGNSVKIPKGEQWKTDNIKLLWGENKLICSCCCIPVVFRVA